MLVKTFLTQKLLLPKNLRPNKKFQKDVGTEKMIIAKQLFIKFGPKNILVKKITLEYIIFFSKGCMPDFS